MAIKLEDKPNTEAPSTAFPYGNIKDNPGDNSGTPVNKLVYADFHQFFAKLMDAGGVVYNGLAENFTNGFQYFLALVEVIKSNCGFYDNIASTITVNPLFTIGVFTARAYADGTVSISLNASYSGAIAADAVLLSGLPTSMAPIQAFRTIIQGSGSTERYIDLLYVTGNVITTSSISGAFNSISIALTYKKA